MRANVYLFQYSIVRPVLQAVSYPKTGKRERGNQYHRPPNFKKPKLLSGKLRWLRFVAVRRAAFNGRLFGTFNNTLGDANGTDALI